MNTIFLDYDGVVNTPIQRPDGTTTCNYPEDGAVNNSRCVQLVSEFCQKYNYSIVVSSSWRVYENYKECLINAGLRDGIDILGKTPRLVGEPRHAEIEQYLAEHPEVSQFLIFDDEDEVGELRPHLVLCDPNTGFGTNEFAVAERLHKDFSK